MGTAPLPQLKATDRKRLVAIGSLPVISLALAGLFTALTATSPQVVTAQRSQLSAQYGAKPLRVKAGTTLTQQLEFTQPINWLTVLAPEHSDLTVYLKATTSRRQYPLVNYETNFVLNQKVPAGKYTLEITNPTGSSLSLDVVQSLNYRFAKAPLIENQHQHSNWSLVYHADNRAPMDAPKTPKPTSY